MDSPRDMTSSHQAIMKCPWQWREPFLDEKRESRKRKAGDGCFYDPVDPSFVDHLLPGYAKKLCTDTLELDEKEQIQREIERLQLKKEAEHDAFVASAAMIYDALFLSTEQDGDDSPHGRSSSSTSSSSSSSALADDDEQEVSTENQALVDSILLMTKAVEDASQASSLLASPLSDASSSSDEEEMDMESGTNSSDESGAEEPMFDSFSCINATDSAAKAAAFDRCPSPSLELMSDNMQESFISVDDDTLLDFDSTSTSSDAKRDA